MAPAQAADTPVTTVPEMPAPTEETEPAPEIVEPVAPAAPERSTAAPRAAVLAGLFALLGLFVAGVPLAKRRRRRRRRLAASTPADRVLVAWAEATEDLAAAGMAPRPEETAPEFAHRVCRAAGPAGAALVRLADDTSAAAWSAVGVASEVAARAEMEAANVAEDLRARATLPDRIRKSLDPRPLLPPSPDRRRAPVATGVGRAA